MLVVELPRLLGVGKDPLREKDDFLSLLDKAGGAAVTIVVVWGVKGEDALLPGIGGGCVFGLGGGGSGIAGGGGGGEC